MSVFDGGTVGCQECGALECKAHGEAALRARLASAEAVIDAVNDAAPYHSAGCSYGRIDSDSKCSCGLDAMETMAEAYRARYPREATRKGGG